MEIIAISLPLPYSLKQITAYVIQNGSSLSIIDAGLHTEETEQAWKQLFVKQDWDFKQVEQIILTHYHPDHYGFAGTLQAWSGAEVFMSLQEYKKVQSFWNQENGNPSQVAEFFSHYGFPEAKLADITRHMEGFRPRIEPHPQVHFIAAGDQITIGGELFHILHTPGHSEGHLSFWQEELGILLAGDVLLPKITPNIPLLPDGDPNPLQTFFYTLEQLKTLPIKIVYPAHGKAFSHYRERIEEIILHHEQRLSKIKHFILTKSSAHAFEVCQFLFAGKTLDTHNLRFAFSETLSHLEYLRLSGELQYEKQAGIFYYQLTHSS